MFVHDEIVHMYFYTLNILFQRKERPTKTKFMPAKLQVVFVCMREVRLDAVLASMESDSAQC